MSAQASGKGRLLEGIDLTHNLRLKKGHQEVRAEKLGDVPLALTGNQKPVGVHVTVRIERLRSRSAPWNKLREASIPRVSRGNKARAAQEVAELREAGNQMHATSAGAQRKILGAPATRSKQGLEAGRSFPAALGRAASEGSPREQASHQNAES